MQNIKYPSIYSQSDQPPLQQHLFENTDQHIKFIPISPSPQQQFSQQQFQPLQSLQPLQPPMYVNQQISIQKNQYVKDLDFLNQKFYLISILSVLVLWTFLYAILYFILAITFYNDMKNYSKTTSIQLPFEIIGLIAFVIIGTFEKFRNTIITNLCYFCAITCYTFLIFSIVACFYSPPSDSISGSTIFLMFLWSIQGANLISTIIFLIYLFIETKQLKLYKTFIFQFICFLPLGFVYWPLLFGMLILLPYTLLLMHVLQQIQKGRFNLKQDQIIAGGLCACFGLFVPFRIGNF